MYSKMRGSIVGERDTPPCESMVFDMSGDRVDVSRGFATDVSEGVPESTITSGGFSVLEGIARNQAEDGSMGSHGGTGGDGEVLFLPAEELFGQEAKSGERSR